MSPWKKKFEEWGGGIAFFIVKEQIPSSIYKSYFSNLPKQHVLCSDVGNELLRSIEKIAGHSLSNSFPVILYIDKSGQVLVLTEGYKIGIPELLINQLNLPF
jgi:hypothetical protein